MFSRRHPYLFFLLASACIFVAASVSFALIGVLAVKHLGFSGITESDGEAVGIVEIVGPIYESKNAIENIKAFRKNEAIKAIVLRIDSPGGGVGPSQEIFREVVRTAKDKKVVASMGTVAASGGYYIAAAATGIVANPGTITGSIGVIMGFSNYRELLDKIGLVPIVIKSGEYKDMGSPVRPMKPEEKEILETLAGKIHQQFIGDVAMGRKMEKEQVSRLADGRIYTGEESMALGLVDRLGNLEDAVAWAGKLGGIEGDVRTVYAKDGKLSFLEYLLTESELSRIVARFLPPDLRAEFRLRPSIP